MDCLTRVHLPDSKSYDSESQDSSLSVNTSISVRTKFRKKQISRKLLVKRPHVLQKIFKNRNQVRSQYYVSQASGVDEANQRDVSKEVTPFKYIKDMELSSHKVASRQWNYQEHLHNLSKSVSVKPSQRNKQNQDILKRTYVSPPEDIGKTITDIDPEWFKIVEGRPILTKHTPSVYVQDLRNCLLTKLQASLHEDEVCRIEENYTLEKQTIEALNRKFKAYVQSAEDMLSKDHQLSMKLLKQADLMMRETAVKDDRLKQLSKQLGQINVRIYVLEDDWRNLKMYQKFLYQIAPMSWRKENDYIHKRNGEIIADWQSIYGKHELKETSIGSLIEMFLKDVQMQEPPKLYFTEPMEVIKVFREIESQNLNSLLHSEDLATPLENMGQILKETEENLEKEYQIMEEMITEIEDNIAWYEDQSAQLEETTKSLLNTTFRQLVAEDKALTLYSNIEDLYENVIAPNDANIGMVPMMKAIETQYEKLMLELDTISLDAVKSAETEQYAEEERQMRQAKEAAKKVDLIDTLTYKLQKVLEKSDKRKTRELRPRSPPPRRIKEQRIDHFRQLTSEEIEYLLFFTKWCWHDDPALFARKSRPQTCDLRQTQGLTSRARSNTRTHITTRKQQTRKKLPKLEDFYKIPDYNIGTKVVKNKELCLQ